MTTFEEQFPSLKYKGRKYQIAISGSAIHATEGEIIKFEQLAATDDMCRWISEERFVLQRDIQQHCLDKQKVRDTIQKLNCKCCRNTASKELEEELGI